jgi:DNA-binding IclR family transcriptional regulator
VKRPVRHPDASSDALSGAAKDDLQPASVRVIARAFEVLRILALGGERGMRLTDVVAYSGLSRPTVHRILGALIAEGACEQDQGTRLYRVGPEISLLGLSRPAQLPVRSAAEAHLADLADELGDTVYLTIRAGLDSIVIDRKTGSYPIKVLAFDVGMRRPLGVGIAGVLLLAMLAPEEVHSICSVNLARLPADGPSMELIRKRVDAARRNGYAYAEAGVLQSTRALAVPVLDAGGQAIAALTVAAMADRLAQAALSGIVDAMRNKAALITRRLAELQRGQARLR